VARKEVKGLIHRLHAAQQRATEQVLEHADWARLGHITPDGFTVNDTLRMWVWHFWAHHRELVLARGRLTCDNSHFHVPHYLRQANEEFGRFIGELACLDDTQLDLRLPDKGRSIREIVEHTLSVLEDYFGEQLADAAPPSEGDRVQE
jgi:hypothetical protein